MRRLSWRDSATATAPPRIRVERFCGRARHRVHLLGEVRCIKTHYRFGENTMPCLAPDEACPFCADPVWKARNEHFGPALVMNTKEQLWVPIVAVFTPGGYNKLRTAPPGAYRGRLLDVWRQQQGTAGGGILMVKELSRVDPVMPAFDIETHLLRLWFPSDETIPPAEIPAPVPFTAEAVPFAPEPKPQPLTISPEERAKVRELLAKAKAMMTPDEQPAPASDGPADGTLPVVESVTVRPAAPADAAPPSITPSPEKAMDAVERRRLQKKLGQDIRDGKLDEVGSDVDAILNRAAAPGTSVRYTPGRPDAGSVDLVAGDGEVLASAPIGGTVPFSRNGSHKKGGGR